MQAVALRRVIHTPSQRPGLVIYRLGPAKLYLDDIDLIHQTLRRVGEERCKELPPGETLSTAVVSITAGEATADVAEDLSEARPEELRKVRISLGLPLVVVQLGYPASASVSALASDADGLAAAQGIRDYVNSRSRWHSRLRPIRRPGDVLILIIALVISLLLRPPNVGLQYRLQAVAVTLTAVLVTLTGLNFFASYRAGSVRVIARKQSESRGLSADTRKQLLIGLAGAIVGAAILGVLGFWAGLYSGH
jgi:hypothetical protein